MVKKMLRASGYTGSAQSQIGALLELSLHVRRKTMTVRTTSRAIGLQLHNIISHLKST